MPREVESEDGRGGMAEELATYPRRTSSCTPALPFPRSSSSSPFMPAAEGGASVFGRGSGARFEGRAESERR